MEHTTYKERLREVGLATAGSNYCIQFPGVGYAEVNAKLLRGMHQKDKRQKSEVAPTEIPAVCKKTMFTVRGVKYWKRFPDRLWTLHPWRVHKSSGQGPEQPGLTLKLDPP